MRINSTCVSKLESLKTTFMVFERIIVDKLRSTNTAAIIANSDELASSVAVEVKIARIMVMMRQIVQDVPVFLARAFELRDEGLIDLSLDSDCPNSTAFVQLMVSGAADRCKSAITHLCTLESLEADLRHCMDCCICDLAAFNSFTESLFGSDYLQSIQ
jgi:hypothetical protein